MLIRINLEFVSVILYEHSMSPYLLSILCIFSIEQPKCTTKVDLQLVIDITGSLTLEGFQREVALAIDIIESFKNEMGSSDNRVGFLFFNNAVKFPQPFSYDIDSIIDDLNNIPYIRGSTNLVAPLIFLLSDVFTNETRRAGAQRVVMYLTDGKQSVAPAPGESIDETERILGELSSRLQYEQDVRLVVIGLGTGIDEVQLRAIATDPDDSNFFVFDTFDAADGNITAISDSLCVEGNAISLFHFSSFIL